MKHPVAPCPCWVPSVVPPYHTMAPAPLHRSLGLGSLGTLVVHVHGPRRSSGGRPECVMISQPSVTTKVKNGFWLPGFSSGPLTLTVALALAGLGELEATVASVSTFATATPPLLSVHLHLTGGRGLDGSLKSFCLLLRQVNDLVRESSKACNVDAEALG